MKKKLNILTEVIFRLRLLKLFIFINRSGYLNEIGWINSFKMRLPVDKNNQPLAWLTYSFMDFLENRLNKSIKLFEFGSGNSTLYFSKYVHSVTSVENNKEWYEKFKEKPNNVTIYYKEIEYTNEYSRFTKTLDIKFDMIIIDGRNRVNCIKNSLDSLTETGVLILDDSERVDYKTAIDFLKNNGFRKIDFWGLAPGVFYKKCTTLFYKNKNCLGL